ncbi:hypothetical protein BDW42DRAFT_190259 [Aspergillus taichungensis]|uniref:Hydrophobin n=1 Tax=Aspergillus taichungensis TaxID=482145 RepID=A0A2J5I8K7_9EURO|nr:hypothetical protein BDW42DRAFT_190259 [Aspergillus taichungensis]
MQFALRALGALITVPAASQKCGSKARFSCCNDATHISDDIQVNGDLVSGELGVGASSQGVSLPSGCSDLV